MNRARTGSLTVVKGNSAIGCRGDSVGSPVRSVGFGSLPVVIGEQIGLVEVNHRNSRILDPARPGGPVVLSSMES